jgi:hypothetical protein
MLSAAINNHVSVVGGVGVAVNFSAGISYQCYFSHGIEQAQRLPIKQVLTTVKYLA